MTCGLTFAVGSCLERFLVTVAFTAITTSCAAGRQEMNMTKHKLEKGPLQDTDVMAFAVVRDADAARAFYEGYGFVGTGELEPLRPESEQRIELMRIGAPPTG